MPLRDLFLFGVMLYLVPKILTHPYIGALTWVMFGVLSPHRLTWGPAYDFQFSLLIAVLTLIGFFLTKEHRKLKGGAAGIVLIIFTAWICFTTLFAFNPGVATAYLERVIKVFAMTGVLLILLHTKRHVELLVWMIVIAMGFYGTKGGIFTIVRGGEAMVFGPDGSMMAGNNSLGVGLTIVVPLIVHLYQQYRNIWMRLGLAGAAVLCSISVLGTYSRGALLAVLAMGCLLWARSEHKLPLFVGALLFTLIAIPAMPDRWVARMRTIENYEQDSSAMGRLIAWRTAYNIAKDRFPIGGGLEWNSSETYAKYSPVPTKSSLVAHSIYFQVLGSQGFIGLALFLIFWTLVWLQCAWIRRNTRDRPDLRWAYSLASMTQVSLVGYAVGGAFLDLAFWDVPYYVFAAIAVTQYAVKHELAQIIGSQPVPKGDAVDAGARIDPISVRSR